jgi:hypothetical protein
LGFALTEAIGRIDHAIGQLQQQRIIGLSGVTDRPPTPPSAPKKEAPPSIFKKQPDGKWGFRDWFIEFFADTLGRITAHERHANEKKFAELEAKLEAKIAALGEMQFKGVYPG